MCRVLLSAVCSLCLSLLWPVWLLGVACGVLLPTQGTCKPHPLVPRENVMVHSSSAEGVLTASSAPRITKLLRQHLPCRLFAMPSSAWSTKSGPSQPREENSGCWRNTRTMVRERELSNLGQRRPTSKAGPSPHYTAAHKSLPQSCSCCEQPAESMNEHTPFSPSTCAKPTLLLTWCFV